MTEGVTISLAGPERLAEIEPLWWTLHAHHIATDYPRHAKLREERQTWASRSPDFAAMLETPDAFLALAEQAGALVGYGLVHFVDASTNWRISGERYAELESLVVLPDRRGQGIGEQIMKAIYARMREVGALELSVRVVHANDGANRFYQREGLQPWHATYAGPIPDGEDAN
jgi:GNAT superfamily N-acetyltransferase